mmetsp:Transcript_27937/g.46851  ORF Transcript_27937/g.46851 Transcript_27937/m.46851 type:complete len:128 (+) Transcript_27937:178-561(+)
MPDLVSDLDRPKDCRDWTLLLTSAPEDDGLLTEGDDVTTIIVLFANNSFSFPRSVSTDIGLPCLKRCAKRVICEGIGPCVHVKSVDEPNRLDNPLPYSPFPWVSSSSSPPLESLPELAQAVPKSVLL